MIIGCVLSGDANHLPFFELNNTDFLLTQDGLDKASNDLKLYPDDALLQLIETCGNLQFYTNKFEIL